MIVHTTGLVKRYGLTTALDGLDLAVPEGGIFAFLGPNGAGKTTAIRVLCGLTKMDAGSAHIAGRDITREPLRVKALCGLAAQQMNLDGDLTASENLEFHGRLYGMPRPARRTAARELLDYVDLSDRAGSLVKTLSGGLKRRLMLARALMHRPRLLFLDEPTAGLDPGIRRRVWSLVKKVRSDGVSVFLTTHYIEEAEILADRVGFIDAGRLVAGGTPEELMAGIGRWAVDRYRDGELASRYFGDREAANAYLREGEGELTLRRVNLEDAFLSLTGRRVG